LVRGGGEQENDSINVQPTSTINDKDTNPSSRNQRAEQSGPVAEHEPASRSGNHSIV
jgi:hypothetical protein